MEEIMSAEQMLEFAKQQGRDKALQESVKYSIKGLKSNIENNREPYSVVRSNYKNGITEEETLQELIKLGYRKYTEPVYSGGVRQTCLYFTFK